MEDHGLGRVTVAAKVENLGDLFLARRGDIPDSTIRRVTIEDALVDTGATGLSLPTSVIQRLGLAKRADRQVRTSVGVETATLYDAVRLTIMDRDCTMDVLEVPDGTATLVGRVPLGVLDFVVDPRGQRLIGNPAHGGEQVFEMY